MEEFKKTFCHCDENKQVKVDPPKKFDAFKKRVSSLIGIREIKSISLIQKEISVDFKAAEIRVHAAELINFLPNLRKRMSNFGVFLGKFSFPLKTQSLDLNKLRSKSSICLDLKRRYSLLPTKSCNNIKKSFSKHRRLSLYNII
jgi:hypothetical protein